LKPTPAAWALFFTGYTLLIIADILVGVPFRAFQLVIYLLIFPCLHLLYKGTAGKGGTALRALIVMTQFGIGYALAALVWLVYTGLAG